MYTNDCIVREAKDVSVLFMALLFTLFFISFHYRSFEPAPSLLQNITIYFLIVLQYGTYGTTAPTLVTAILHCIPGQESNTSSMYKTGAYRTGQN